MTGEPWSGRARAYVESDAHREGADLDLLVEPLALRCGDLVADRHFDVRPLGEREVAEPLFVL